MIEKYYEEELRYLYESGREFANAHPDRAHYLNIDSVGDRDPYVERLFEGFAFLAARIREKLDDTFPQITEGLSNLLWPQFLQVIPSVTILQFGARTGMLQEARTIPARSEVLSGPTGPESVTCRFTTTNPVVINPIELRTFSRHTDNLNNEIMTFVFDTSTDVDWNHYDLSTIRLFLHAELPTALMVHRALTNKVKKVEIEFSTGEKYNLDPKSAITPAGISKEETLLPSVKNGFWGHNLLREYFVYHEKFLFVDINGIDELPAPSQTPPQFTVRVTTGEKLNEDNPVYPGIFKLHCCPASNIYISNVEPILKEGLKSEYRVIADASHANSVHAHSIRSVTGVDRVTGERFSYEPMYTFKNIGNNSKKTFSTRFVHTPSGNREMNIVLGGPQLKDGDLSQESLILEAWCTNGHIPREHIKEGEITSPGKGFPQFARISNITRPSLPFIPPADKELLWNFQAHLAATQASIASPETLKKYLSIYDWSGQEGRARRIQAIEDVDTEPMEFIFGGSVVRGVRFNVGLQEQAFKDIGDLHLFGLILSKFLSHYVTINSFCELVFILKPSGKTMEWNQLKGKKCLL
ncbi:type VI secretion system baseplate subunit TssF [Chitinispirillales bacterium ANBcel5]|uniref:type VI secretion system baseplate subunit TssF n=1 Tax=Cellulosispirillum alkaliphilum TaxID=3039283 RepID=UPI002A528B1C|nr:type VI secretion system baseplate subunit TssF [Chitinispirillales bacterium ANBcel5]